MTKIEAILEDIRNGVPVMISDDKDREDEFDLLIAAEKLTHDSLMFGIKCLGRVCVAATKDVWDRIGVGPMVQNSTCKLQTGFAVTIDLLGFGMCSGVSLFDRFKTIKAIIDPNMKSENFARPGHIDGLIARDGLLKVRRGHTETACELLKLAGLQTCGIIVEVMNGKTGEMLRGKKAVTFAKKHNLKMISIQEVYDAVYGSTPSEQSV